MDSQATGLSICIDIPCPEERRAEVRAVDGIFCLLNHEQGGGQVVVEKKAFQDFIADLGRVQREQRARESEEKQARKREEARQKAEAKEQRKRERQEQARPKAEAKAREEEKAREREAARAEKARQKEQIKREEQARKRKREEEQERDIFDFVKKVSLLHRHDGGAIVF